MRALRACEAAANETTSRRYHPTPNPFPKMEGAYPAGIEEFSKENFLLNLSSETTTREFGGSNMITFLE